LFDFSAYIKTYIKEKIALCVYITVQSNGTNVVRHGIFVQKYLAWLVKWASICICNARYQPDVRKLTFYIMLKRKTFPEVSVQEHRSLDEWIKRSS
jgi:hypothetical protein